MTLQVLGMKVRLGAVRARELSVRILLRDLGLRSASSGSGRRRTSRSTRKNAASSLGAYHMSGLLAVWQEHRRRQRTLWVGRVHARLGHLAGSRHEPKNRRHPSAWGCRTCDGLGMNRGSRLLLLVGVVRHRLVTPTTGILARGRGRVRSHVRGDWSVRAGGT
jgi:hypothetical protein